MSVLIEGAGSRSARSAGVAVRLCAVVVGLLAVGVAPSASAWEALDGKIQAHGYYEAQLRVISADYNDDWDLSQWYNVFNLELEFDFAPEGIGPIDLLQAFVRIEARYDCIYSRGCGFVRAADAYGDRTKNLPKRLANGKESTFHGAIELDDIRVPRNFWRATTVMVDDDFTVDSNGDGDFTNDFVERVEARMFIEEQVTVNGQDFGASRGVSGREPFGLDQAPGFSGLAQQRGADQFVGQAPCFQTGNINCSQSIGPRRILRRRPGGVIELFREDPDTIPLVDDQTEGIVNIVTDPSDPPGFLGRSGDFFLLDDDPFPATFGRFDSYRFTAIKALGGAAGGEPVTALGPWLPKNEFLEAGMLADIGNPFDNATNSGSIGRLFEAAALNGAFRDSDTGINFNADAVLFDPDAPRGIAELQVEQLPLPDDVTDPFAGEQNRSGTQADPLTIIARNARGGFDESDPALPFVQGAQQEILDPASPSRFTTAKPFRAIPIEPAFDARFFVDREARMQGFLGFDDLLSRGTPEQIDRLIAAGEEKFRRSSPRAIGRLAITEGGGRARGLYIPSRPFQRMIAEGVGNHPFNIDETDRAWNRGESQDDEGELKEAFFDIEMFDHQLWLRLGKQNIVWGKTELFRTTDQFNPQDLGLAVLPNLEESRIALWSARAVYSLYDVGPLRDVRLEAAINLDDNEPADLGACGEPYAPLPVCQATFGLFAHGTTGIGLAGVEKPPSPWEDARGWEVGGRVEWRWGRYSFAVADFYGYDDLPFIDIIGQYERNVDLDTGRPRAYGTLGPCRTQPIAARQAAAPGSAFGMGPSGELFEPDADCLQVGPSIRQQNLIASSDNRTNRPDLRSPGELVDGVVRSIDVFGFTITRTRAQNEFLADRGAVNREGSVVLDPALITSIADVPDTDGDGRPNPEDFAGLIEDEQGNIYDPSRPFNATGAVRGPNDLTLIPGLGSYSPNNSLDAHSANQQLFGVICASTVGVSTVDTGACAATVLGSGNPIPPFFFTASHVIGGALAGAIQGDRGDSVALTVNAAAGALGPAALSQYVAVGPLVRLNRDLEDGEANGTGLTALNDPNNFGCVDSSVFYASGGSSRAAQFPSAPLGSLEEGEGISLIPCHSGGGGQLADIGRGLGQHLSVEQQALLGCGPIWGTNCDDSGIDLLNMEASSIIQSWPGFEGTADPAGVNFRRLTDLEAMGVAAGPLPTIWTTNNRLPNGRVHGRSMFAAAQDREQPGTLFFQGGPVATFYDRASGELKQLAGTRGLAGNPETREVFVDAGWDAGVDGCPMTPDTYQAINAAAGRTVGPGDAGFDALTAGGCGGMDTLVNRFGDPIGVARRDLVHPLVNINPLDVDPTTAIAQVESLDVSDGSGGTMTVEATRQYFRSEMAAVSFNFLALLATLDSEFEDRFPFALCQPLEEDINGSDADLRVDPRCATDSAGAEIRTCSLVTPQFCSNVRGIMSLTGVQRNIVRAGGDGTFGRRTFLWHSGGEAVLRYNKRNVLGFSIDFAEDITKSNFSLESTWIEGVKRSDPNSFTGVGSTDDINVTLSMDRPTFVNFLNANRTIFFNAQFFFQYRIGHEKGLGGPNGPWNLLLTFTAFTGYFQDRLMPRVTLIYDVQSQSGGALTEISYRFNEAFSVILGTQSFFGRTQFNPIALASIAPASNQQGRHAYQTGVVTGAGIVRDVDGVFLRLRYTF